MSTYKLGPCTVSYGGTVLGCTTGGVTIEYEAGLYDRKCDQNYDEVIAQIVTSQMVTVSATFKVIDTVMAELLTTEKISSKLGEDIFPTTDKVLLLTPINANDTYGYSFPKAIMSEKFSAAFYTGTEDDTMDMEFIARKDASGDIMERVAISPS